MSMKKQLALLALSAQMMAPGIDIGGSATRTKTIRSKSPLTKKQAKARAKGKRAKQARKRQRK